MAEHPVVADSALGLYAENLTEFARRRLAPVIVFWLCRHPRKASVVLGQILFFQKLVRGSVTSDPFAPQFFDHSILMDSVVPFHSSLGLGRTCSNDPYAQLLTHASKLGERDFPP